VFGALTEQHLLDQTADEATWLIGAGIFTSTVKGTALRSMLHPGTAYDDPELGKDPQPADMSGYVDTTDDNGGVHINSGIPNRAFFLAAKNLSPTGHSWEKAGKVWYATYRLLDANATFQTAARATAQAAAHLFGDTSAEKKGVTAAWSEVGVGV
jgi:Zn-dependent metalloprotease